MIIGYFPATRGNPELSLEIHRMAAYRRNDTNAYSTRIHFVTDNVVHHSSCDMSMESNLFGSRHIEHPQYFWKYETV